MKKLTKLQYEVIFLYSRGLTFKEIDRTLTTSSRGLYSQVVKIDAGRVGRAKTSRKINLNSYKIGLDKYLDEVKTKNKLNSKYTILIDVEKASFRKDYLNNSLDRCYKSYNKYRLAFLKNHIKKVS